jgi:hypothetical protein
MFFPFLFSKHSINPTRCKNKQYKRIKTASDREFFFKFKENFVNEKVFFYSNVSAFAIVYIPG